MSRCDSVDMATYKPLSIALCCCNKNKYPSLATLLSLCSEGLAQGKVVASIYLKCKICVKFFYFKMSVATLAPQPTESHPVRRLSSIEATRENIQMTPTVVVPPQHLRSPSAGSEIASGLETARRSLRSAVAPDLSNLTTPTTSVTDKYAFAFDIDGVLIRGGRPIPEAIEAMKMLNGENEYGIQVPYIFVTNGGGKTEAERCIQLSQQLEIEVSPGQFICGHTPMRDMAGRYKTVLVVGGEGEKCRAVAEGYGFKDV